MLAIALLSWTVSSAIAAQPSTPVRMTHGSVNHSDYPRAARGAEGTAVALLTVGTDGRVLSCTIGQSSGNPALDQATCPLIRVRHRFRPATQDGEPVIGPYRLSIYWRAPRR
jgi:protein TonB